MGTTLLVASGGGGDALAAAIVHAATSTGRAHLLTYSWDRLVLDPVPGPRDPSWFQDLEPVGTHNYRVLPTSAVDPPAGSSLPRLARELDDSFYLLDPRGGAAGIRNQVDELVDCLAADAVLVVDVGGDILASGPEPAVRSPLADALVLAGTSGISVPVEVMVAGPGLDGELTEEEVLRRSARLSSGSPRVELLGAEAVTKFLPVLRWLPSEATALLCAAARGARGRTEIRDHGGQVILTDRSAELHRFAHEAVLLANGFAARLTNTSSFDEAERVLRDVGVESELAYERGKADRLEVGLRGPAAAPANMRQRIIEVQEEATDRRLDFMTLRRVGERLGVSPDDFDDLIRDLSDSGLGHYDPPLWMWSSH